MGLAQSLEHPGHSLILLRLHRLLAWHPVPDMMNRPLSPVVWTVSCTGLAAFYRAFFFGPFSVPIDIAMTL